ncbi:MAG: ABC transporter ATP-binding protein/permease [Lachnospiraceae bacterium]|nr:ABC transporter ATP-binding protein/permease [Lachnospiraceae bacterium]
MDEKNKNPYHKSYGVLSNVKYVLSAVWKRDRKLFLIWMLTVFCVPVARYFWSYASRLIIEVVGGDLVLTSEQILKYVLISVSILLFCLFAETYYYGMRWRYTAVRFSLVRIKNEKIMDVDFYHTEDTDVLDCYQRAGNACGGDGEGIQGLIHGSLETIVEIGVAITGIAILGFDNTLISALMLLVAILNMLDNIFVSKYAKKHVWDPLAPWWRKRNYMNWAIANPEPAKDIRVFGLKDWLIGRFREVNVERIDKAKLNSKIWVCYSLINAVIWIISQFIVYGWLVSEVVKRNISVGDFSLYLSSTMIFYNTVFNLTWKFSHIVNCSRQVDDFRSFIDYEGGENDGDVGIDVFEKAKEYTDNYCKEHHIKNDGLRFDFEFKNVSFKYPKGENFALKNMSINIPYGERLAVVGLNGAGKSTFIKLLLRLYMPTEGVILMNGVDISEYNRNSYFKVFAPLFQEVEIFAFPLSENVSMKTPEETNKEKAKECLYKAGLKEKVEALPKGIDTEMLKVVYDDGTDFSGGEKQKLALARALYKDANVIVLDEPTSALDAIAESKLYQDFDSMIGKKSAIYISHRLSSTQFCDKVAMFADGEMIEYGTHKELIEAGNKYSEMYKIQAQYYVDELSEEN